MAKIKVVYDHWYPKLFKIEAITVYPYVLCRAKKEDVTERLLSHEMKHVAQIREEGWLRFYVKYCFYTLLGMTKGEGFWQAYRFNPYEIEAYNTEATALTAEEKTDLGMVA